MTAIKYIVPMIQLEREIFEFVEQNFQNVCDIDISDVQTLSTVYRSRVLVDISNDSDTLQTVSEDATEEPSTSQTEIICDDSLNEMVAAMITMKSDAQDPESENNTEGEDTQYDEEIITQVSEAVFSEWDWALILRSSFDWFDEEELESWGSDWSLAYKSALQRARTSEGGPFGHRCEELRRVNPNFVTELEASSISDLDIKFVIEEQDLNHWLTFESMKIPEYSVLQRHARGPRFGEEYGVPIWKFWHVFRLRWRRPTNRHLIEDRLLVSPYFRERYILQRSDDEEVIPESPFNYTIKSRAKLQKWQENWEMQKLITDPQRVSRESIGFPASMQDHLMSVPNKGSELTIPLILKGYAKAMELDKAELQNPAMYLEFVDWTSLLFIDSEVATSAAKGIIDPDVVSEFNQYCLWEPPTSSPLDSHLIYTDEEVYQYCVVHNWCFPGHKIEDKVLFVLTPLEMTGFIDTLHEFWETWNDCVITQNRDTKQFFLLETRPGRTFRSIKKSQDENAAKMFFRYLVEDHVSSHPGIRLSNILGDGYNSKFDQLLRLIPEHRIHSVSDKPIGAGKNGAVYKAVLDQSHWYLEYMKGSKPEVDVVLKSILPNKEDSLAKFVHELYITYTALAGLDLRKVAFYGITVLPNSDITDAGTGEETSPQRLYLVFEYAELGTLGDYLTMMFKSSDREAAKDWIFILKSFYLITYALSRMHGRGVIHRDLHLGNIFVSKFPKLDDKINPAVDIIIGDLGEGKVVTDTEQQLAIGSDNYHSLRSLPSEVRKEGKWTTASDIYRLGLMAIEILNLRFRFVQNLVKDGEVAVIPKVLKTVIEACIATDPGVRPTARQLTFQIEPYAYPDEEANEQLEFVEATFNGSEGDTESVALGSSAQGWSGLSI